MKGYTRQEQEAVLKVEGNPFDVAPFCWTVDNQSERLPYYEPPRERPVHRTHAGQRKLLLSEIQFLLPFHGQPATVLYIGAAEGCHLSLLSDLFPQCIFDCWDPRRFQVYDFKPKHIAKVRFFNRLFTDDHALKYRGRAQTETLLLISDIRGQDIGESQTDYEKSVARDNDDQARWVRTIQPRLALLKFRIPFDQTQKYPYLSGTLLLQPWAPIHSAETRLVTCANGYKEYDPKEYEEKMMYVNQILREFGRFRTGEREKDEQNDTKAERILCFDCAYEKYILSLLKAKGIQCSSEKINQRLHKPFPCRRCQKKEETTH